MYIFIFVIFYYYLFIYLSHPRFYFLLKSSCDGYPPLQDSPLVDVDVDNNSIPHLAIFQDWTSGFE